MIGPADGLDSESRTKVVNRAAVTVSQNIMYGFKVLGLALTVHDDTRNKMLMDLPCAHDYCVPYGRTPLMETSLANAVVENTREFQGLYVPPFFKKGAFVFFAVDNTDFSEDTAYG